MRSKVCSSKRLKIVVTPDDLKPYGLNFNDINCHEQRTRESLKEIILTAVKRSDFHVDAKTVFLEMIPSIDGGGVLYLTQSDQFGYCSTGLSDNKKSAYIFAFDDFDNLTDAVKSSQSLLTVRCLSDSLYQYKNSYYLKCEVMGCANDLYMLFKQFDGYIPKSDYGSVLSEHGKCLISENASKTLLKHFA